MLVRLEHDTFKMDKCNKTQYYGPFIKKTTKTEVTKLPAEVFRIRYY